jgi:shikimate kinase
MNIVLTGYRGTGKTTVGQILAKKLALPFYDTDDLIQEQAGQTIREIVSSKGWGAFRELEKETVALVALHDNCVIALGGGAVMEEENVNRLRLTSLICWLTARVETIFHRMTHDDKSDQLRPPLTGEDRMREIVVVMNERAPFYERAAHFSVTTDDREPEEIAEEIISEIKRVRSRGEKTF